MQDKITPNQIVEELIQTEFVKNYLRKRAIGSQYLEDMEQDIYIILLEYPLLTEIYNKKGINGVRQITSGIIQRSLSTKGKFYRMYHREITYTENEIPETCYEQKISIQV